MKFYLYPLFFVHIKLDNFYPMTERPELLDHFSLETYMRDINISSLID
jgi:hypothetical protein